MKTSIVIFLLLGIFSFNSKNIDKKSESGYLNFKNWGLINSRESHISAPEAWSKLQYKNKIIVAVLDTGVDLTHLNNIPLWTDPASLLGQPIHGWDMVEDHSNPIDTIGHGTHIAGIIAASRDDSRGIVGVASNVEIMSIRFYSPYTSGDLNTKHLVKAIHYAIDHGAQIINISAGGPGSNDDEYLAIKESESLGILVVVAAGNQHLNIDLELDGNYPASYHTSNMITVASLDFNNNLVSSSNWGSTVDVGAPGELIYSLLPGNSYGYMTGTSQATAFVSGLGAMILGENPLLTPSEVKNIILESVDVIPNLKNQIKTSGRINALTAVGKIQNKKSWNLVSFAD